MEEEKKVVAPKVAPESEEFSEDNIPESNWMKFTNIGDMIIGTFNSKNDRSGDAGYSDQTVYVLTNCKVNGVQKDVAEEWLLGINITDSNYVNDRLKKVVAGQRMGVKFEKEIPTTVKGHNNAKSLMPNVFGMDGNFEKFVEPEEATIEEAMEQIK